jgi:hypothetical protein
MARGCPSTTSSARAHTSSSYPSAWAAMSAVCTARTSGEVQIIVGRGPRAASCSATAFVRARPRAVSHRPRSPRCGSSSTASPWRINKTVNGRMVSLAESVASVGAGHTAPFVR